MIHSSHAVRSSTPVTPLQKPQGAIANPSPVTQTQATQTSVAPSLTRTKTAAADRPLDVQADVAQVIARIDQTSAQEILGHATRLSQAGVVPKGFPRITAEELQTARQNLRPVSQHQVLNVHEEGESDSQRSTVVESGRSVKLGQGGSPFGVGMPLKAGGTLDIVGHGSPDGRTIGGKTAKQLARHIQESGVTHLASINLKSCHSQAFAQALSREIDVLNQNGANLNIEKITGASSRIAIDRATGNTLTELQVSQAGLSVNHDGLLGYTPEALLEKGHISEIVKDGKVTILPFTNASSGACKADVIQGVQAHVGAAMKQALQEIEDGELLGNLSHPDNVKRFASGHLASAIEHCKVSDAGNPKYDSTLIANVGYLIEDRVTQILIEKHGFDSANFQCTIGKSRPDIVLDGGNLLVDLTASASSGHILHKDASVWFSPGVQSLEVTYPSFTLDGAKAVIKSQVVDLAATEQAQKEAKDKHNAFVQGVKDFVKDQIYGVTTYYDKDKDQIYYNPDLNTHNKQAAFDYAATKLGLGRAELHHVLAYYRGTDLSVFQSPANAKASRSLEQATRGLDKLFARVDVTASADTFELFQDYQARRKPLPEEIPDESISDDDMVMV